MSDDFYIGYSGSAPTALAKLNRRIVGGAAVFLSFMAAAIALRQVPADPGYFGFGIATEFEGTLYETPLPILRTVAGNGVATNYLLVGEGKFGPPAYALGHDGQRVRFKGSPIQKGRSAMIELNDQRSFQVLGPGPAAARRPQAMIVGKVVLTGELVDTKCYLGVMRPAVGKVHRACAVRCLSGGVPPGLLVQDKSGSQIAVPLVGDNGGRISVDPQWAARTLTVEGTLEIVDGLPLLKTGLIRLHQD